MLPEISQVRSDEPSKLASSGTGICAGTSSQSGPPKQYSSAPTTCLRGVLLSAKKTGIEKSAWNLLSAPHPPKSLSDWMIASLRSDLAAADTSLVHGCAPLNRSPLELGSAVAFGVAPAVGSPLAADAGLPSVLAPQPTPVAQSSTRTPNHDTRLTDFMLAFQ